MRIHNRREMVLAMAGGGAALLAACSPTPTPVPEKPAAAAAPGLNKLFLMVDTVTSSANIPAAEAKNRSCVLSSRFPRNGAIVFRARVHDPKTGDLMDKAAVKSVSIELANGKKVEADYGPHPKEPPNEFYWTGAYKIPKDHPTGTLKFGVTATATDGRIGKFEPMMVAASLPVITEEILEDAPPKKA